MIHLWPGDWKSQLTEPNHHIHEEYQEKVRGPRHGHVKKVHKITEREFWVFSGIVLTARLKGRKGGRLWDQIEPEGYGSKVDVSPHIKEHHFLDIKRFVPFLFAEESKKPNNLWWQFSKAVKDYNKDRKKPLSRVF